MDHEKTSARTSPAKKRPKVAKRKTYFFQPQNTLAYNPRSAPSHTETTHTTNHTNTSTLTNAHTNTDPKAHTNTDPRAESRASAALSKAASLLDVSDFLSSSQTRAPVEAVKLYDGSMEQSSDDSFEGVRWKPPTSPRPSMKPILSSPLKLPEQHQNLASTLVNEATDSMLLKYGMGLPETQTPRYSRTLSDGVQLLNSTSPTLLRSKSFDLRPKVEQSLLNTWIDRFTQSKTEREGILDMSKREPKPNSNSDSIPKSFQASSKAVQTEFSDDELSSDEDSFLATLRLDSIVKKPSPATSEDIPLDRESLTTESATKHEPATTNDTSEMDPFSDDLDLSVLGAATQASSAPPAKSAPPAEPPTISESKHGARISYSNPDFRRYQIKSILHTTFNIQNFKRKQLVLSVADQDDVDSKILVRGEAAELDLRVGDIVHVIHTSSENNRLVDDSHNLLIWNPDTLVSSTTVADQLYCPRKTVLGSRIKQRGDHSIPRIAGDIVHELFQLCFVSGQFSMEYLTAVMNEEIEQNLLNIYSMGDVLDELKEMVRKELPNIRQWFQTFYKKAPKTIPTNRRQQKIKFSVADTLDIEESVWSPMFGIKGMVDVTLKATLEGETSHGQFLLPMEIKTGAPQLSHEAQSALYSLLFKDRYNVDITSFLLVYTMREESTTKHDISVSDLKSLVNLRNRISRFLQPGNQDLPDLLRELKCDRCFVQETCMTTNYLKENGSEENSGLLEGKYDDIISHLKSKRPAYSDFLRYWDALLTKEEEFISRFALDLWILSSKTREEEHGKALSSLVIVKQKDAERENGEFEYVFQREKPGFGAMNKTQITKNDRVIISDESGHFALARGVVRQIDRERIVIGSRRRIIPTESKHDRFHRAGVLRSTQSTSQDKTSQHKKVSFRIDKDDLFYGMGAARGNILNMFLPEGDHKRRELVVDSRAPRYADKPLFDFCQADMNLNQVEALRKVSLSKDYSLILGMPGTGKTTVIVHLIKAMVRAKKSVLLASYTNSAVDNILLKLTKHDIDFIRVGSPARVHSRIQDYIPGSEKKRIRSYQDYQNVYGNPLVVASTCLGVADVAFNLRNHFDYCIVDEASQVSMPLSLGPLALCGRFVLVGDHFQLPPLVSHPDPAVKAGLSQSLFQMLATAHPKSVVQLKKQYRMCRNIMLISNQLVYQGRLECGSTEVANQTLEIPHIDALESHASGSKKWIWHALQESNQVVFFDHDSVPGRERAVAENVTNPTEVELIRQTVEGLCACGVAPSQIGVMTIYRAQLKLLSDAFRHLPDLEILTADQFQGRDKDCIIISMVRSNEKGMSGQLLKDWRRVNVAVTRARAKLIVFGSQRTLSGAESIRDFVSLAQRERWTYDLPPDCLTQYDFPKISRPSPIKNTKISMQTVQKHAIASNILADLN